MKKLFEQLTIPFILLSFIWTGVSLSYPFKVYNAGNTEWPYFGFVIITITILLIINVILTDRRANKKQNKEK
ncbi:MAG: hypothetical protein Q4A47_00830 [Erysipelotrichaceae bacterium]|nr:hypothetical protein [Erysipelotrichaceae bacterium]